MWRRGQLILHYHQIASMSLLTASPGEPHTAHSCTKTKGIELAMYMRMTTTVCWIDRILAREMPLSLLLALAAAALLAIVMAGEYVIRGGG